MQRKKVYQYDREGNLITQFPSVSEAAETNERFFLSGISDAANGKLKTHAGYIWSYKQLWEVKVEKKEKRNIFPAGS